MSVHVILCRKPEAPRPARHAAVYYNGARTHVDRTGDPELDLALLGILVRRLARDRKIDLGKLKAAIDAGVQEGFLLRVVDAMSEEADHAASAV